MLGSGGKLMSTLGVTDLIAQALDIKLTSELSAEISQFSHAEKEEFDNRQELRGCFAEESLKSIKASLSKQGIRESDLINGLLANVDVGLKLIASGRGLFGLLSKLSVDAMINRGIMESAKRARVPRAFLKNRIEKYEEEISAAQNVIQKVKAAERIRMTAMMGTQIACCTERFVFVLNEERTAIAASYGIGDLEIVAKDEVGLEAISKVKGKVEMFVLSCGDREEREEVRLYLASQATMIRKFKNSLI
jgi:hypothetical protein